MHQALLLAGRGLGRTWPNPAVGCVLVREGRIVARGWTQPGGRPHAEAEALKRAGVNTKGATAYVSLEPCAHEGKTPPCADALVSAGIKRCVVATRDPDPRTAGKGIAKLQAAGIEVTEGVLESEARALNAGFFFNVERQRPLFALKVAATKDGAIAAAPSEQTTITGPLARNFGQLLRARHDAVLFGIGTVLTDDPQYTCRLPGMGEQSPVRVLLDSRLRLELESRLVASAREKEAPLWVVTAPGVDALKSILLSEAGVEIIVAEKTDANGRPDLGWLAGELARRGVTRVLVEAGATLNRAFADAGLGDEIHWFESAVTLGPDALMAFGKDGPKAPDAIGGFEIVDKRTLGVDTYGHWRKKD